MSAEFSKRRKPLLHAREALPPILLALFFVVPTIYLLNDLLGGEAAREELVWGLRLGNGAWAVGFFIFVFAIVGVVCFWLGRLVWKLLRGKRLLDFGPAVTTATIIDRRTVKDSGRHPVTPHYVAFEFDAAQATKAHGTVKLEARVGKDLYERLTPSTTTQVRYAEGIQRR